MKWTTETGEVRCLGVHSVPEWGTGSQCDPSDLIACLKANPEAAGQVLLALESQYIACEMAKVKAAYTALEAENAQLQSKIDTLEMTQAPAGSLTFPPGCKEYAEAYRLFVGTKDSTTIEWTEREQERMRLNAEILTLKARAEKAERELADALASRATIDAYVTQLVRERDDARAKLIAAEEAADCAEVVATQRLESLAHDHAKAVAERDEARATASRYLQSWNNEANDIRETLNKVVAREKTALSRIAKLESDLAIVADERNALRSALIDSQRAVVESMRERIAKLEAVVDAARQWNECVGRGFMSAMRPDVARARLLAALRALDEQDSGGPAAVEVPVTTEPRGDGTREDAPSAGSTGSSPLRTLEPDALAEALKTAKLDLCPRCHGSRTVGAGYIVGGLRASGQLGGEPHEPRIPCPACAQHSGGSGAPRDAHTNGDESPRASDAERGKPAASDAAGSSQDSVTSAKAPTPEPAGSSRCGGCQGFGIIPGTSAYDTEQCRECHGTGLFCPSQLIAAHPVGEQHAYLTRAEVAEMVAEACQTVAEQAVGGVGSFALRALAAELRKGGA